MQTKPTAALVQARLRRPTIIGWPVHAGELISARRSLAGQRDFGYILRYGDRAGCPNLIQLS